MYATIDDIQRRMPQFQLTQTTRPNLDTASVFLEDTEAQFNAALENLGYVVPITGEKSLSQCKEIVAQGVIAKLLYARAAAVGTDATFQSADRAQALYDKALRELADARGQVFVGGRRVAGERLADARQHVAEVPAVDRLERLPRG